MRLLFLLVFLALPQLSQAQFNRFETGSYVLAANPAVRHTSELRLRSGNLLLAKNTNEKNIKLTPDQVSSFRLGTRKFTVAGDFHAKGGLGGLNVTKAFVEQLDSGQVILLSYAFQVGAPMSMGSGGAMMGGGSYSANVYLLQWPGEEDVTPAQGGAYSSGGKNFREAVRPFFIGRPDLLKMLDDKRITTSNLPEAVHALN